MLESYESLVGNHVQLLDLLPNTQPKQTHERRAHQRYKLVQFSEMIPLDAELRAVADPRIVTVNEVSASGLSFVCSQHLIQKQMVIQIVVQDKTLHCIIEIVRRRSFGANSHEYGCQFLWDKPASR